MQTVTPARAIFAFATASVAALSLSYGDFVPRGQPYPAWLPGREVWIYGSALLLLAVSGGLCVRRTALPSLVTLGVYQILWILICSLPIFSAPLGIGTWYGFCEALTPLIGAGFLYAMLRWSSRDLPMPIATRRVVRVAQAVLGLTWVFYGWSHFIYADYTAGMVPGWLPDHLGFAYFTGGAHIAAGVAIMVGVLPGLAATLEALMMTLFGLMVWVPSFFMHPRPAWATQTQNQWSELSVNLLLAATAWVLATLLRSRYTSTL
ncbi:MAG TPA: hypothetical protein VGV09_12035 [Steroidobacteraceae bacterium]|nr:hypothetical protein [Steroidobacteraceae bacterium]